MDLKLFFDPVRIDVDQSVSSFQSFIHIHQHQMPSLKDVNIALVGLNKYGEENEEKTDQSANEVRKHLYQFKKGYGNHHIVDLGNLRNGPSLTDTYLRIKEVCVFLMENNIVPILFCGSHDLDLGQYYAYEKLNSSVSLLTIDNTIDIGGDTESTNHTEKIIRHTPNYLNTYFHLAYQNYLTNQQSIELIEKLHFEVVRLGVVKERIREVEPIIRDANMLSFDLSALQVFYAPGNSDSNVYGLTGEEACQLCWYAGLNEKLSSIGLYNYDEKKDTEDKKNAFVMATMIWYFVEGFAHRRGNRQFNSSNFIVYDVYMGENINPKIIKFYKSKLSEKWWMEIPNFEKEEEIFDQTKMISCSYEDYENAQKGKIPDRWIKALNRS